MVNSLARVVLPHGRFVGFDELINEMDEFITQGVAKSPVFPRHNVVKLSEEHYQIQVALAGYDKDDLSMTREGNILVLSGGKEDEAVNYIHKGISAKKFSKEFRLNENMVVADARFENGLLLIDLDILTPDEDVAKNITIS